MPIDSMPRWFWPSNEEINDFPDPLGFDREWQGWHATLAEGPSVHAEIFAREYLQNSWDSIQAQMARMAAAGTKVDRNGVEFRFVELTGADAERFLGTFGIDGHRTRYSGMTDRHRKDNRLGGSEVISSHPESIKLLVASEYCGQGMFGPWRTGGRAGVVSRLKSALMHTRSEKNNDTAGGSWGHGKKAIANASKCRTIAVYTHFDDEYADDEVDRRFLGVSYWKSHDLGDLAHVGIGLLGTETGEVGTFTEQFRPLQDREADRFVEELTVPGLDVRSNGDPASLGTTYLIVEPSFSSADLASALERNWWPLLAREPGAISVVDYDGSTIPLVPADRQELVPFLHARDLAIGADDPRERGDDVGSLTASGKAVGTLSLTSDDSEDGWSYADPDTNRTLVALVRNDMVIAYEPFPRKQRQKGPFLRGVLIVDRDNNQEANELLRMSEPHLHNEWQTEAGNAVPEDAARFATATFKALQARVGALRSSLKEEGPQVAQRFPVFSQVFSEGKAPSVTPPRPPRHPPRPFKITGASDKHLDANLKDPTQIRVETTVELSLTEKQLKTVDHLEVFVTLGWRVLEESGAVLDATLLDDSSISVPAGFDLVDEEKHKYRGWLNADPKPFTWQTRFFPDDWRIVPDPQVIPVGVETESSDGEEGAA